ncbi:uncharacterized protein LOC128964642 [Oppia nitens]|uniref:uncharacterized protein LOC128964642 n=1 Tax=Oppia nitens TaxID=1686743 RepID=UPI0023D9A178|nr:uncharacterized protein LOC128964642 [Oppia nitens]
MKNKQFSIVLLSLIVLILIDQSRVIESKPKPLIEIAVVAGGVVAYKHYENVKKFNKDLKILKRIYGDHFNGTQDTGKVIIKDPTFFKKTNKKSKSLTTTTTTTPTTTTTSK